MALKTAGDLKKKSRGLVNSDCGSKRSASVLTWGTQVPISCLKVSLWRGQPWKNSPVSCLCPLTPVDVIGKVREGTWNMLLSTPLNSLWKTAFPPRRWNLCFSPPSCHYFPITTIIFLPLPGEQNDKSVPFWGKELQVHLLINAFATYASMFSK